MIDYLDNDPIRELIHFGNLEVLSGQFSRLAYQHLANHFPISSGATTSIVDWKSVPHRTLDWANSTDDEAVLWSKSTLAGKCSSGMLLYSESLASVLGPFDFVVRHFDTLIWKAPGCRVLFGVERSEDGTLIFTDGIIETDGKSQLFASIETAPAG